MSTAHALGAPAGRASRAALLRWVAGGTALVALVVALAIALWPASAAETARDDGERFGAAVAQLQSAQTSAEVDAALTEMHAAATDARDHAGDEVAAQEDALARAADGFVGVHTSDDSFSVDVYQAELNDAVDDVTGQAEDFRTQGPEVRQAFWDGYQDGLAGA